MQHIYSWTYLFFNNQTLFCVKRENIKDDTLRVYSWSGCLLESITVNVVGGHAFNQVTSISLMSAGVSDTPLRKILRLSFPPLSSLSLHFHHLSQHNLSGWYAHSVMGYPSKFPQLSVNIRRRYCSSFRYLRK